VAKSKKKSTKQDTSFKNAPATSHVEAFRRDGKMLEVKFKTSAPTYRYSMGSAPRAAGVLSQLRRARHPGKVVWSALRRPGVSFKKL
jgi:hypothetical protein